MTGYDPATSSPAAAGPGDLPQPADSHAGDWVRAGPAARSRLEARLRRAAVVAAVTASAGLGLILLALFATNLLRDLLLSTRWQGAVAVVANSLLAAAAALCAWMLFYALRLADRSGRATPGDAAGNLRKLRAGTCMLIVASLALFTIGQDGGGPLGDLGLVVPGCLASAVCGYLLVSLRRLAWDVAMAQGAVIVAPGGGRGFAVLSASAPPQGTALPVASALAAPAARVAVTDAAPWEEGSGFREWETLLTVLAVLAVAVYVFRTPAAVAFIAAIVDNPAGFADLASAAFGRPARSGPNRTEEAWAVLGSLGLAMCALAWVFWGLLCLTAGARLRGATITLAAATLGLLAVILGVHASWAMQYSSRSAYLFRRRYEDRLMDPFQTASPVERVAIECVLPVVLLFVLTRRPVKELFSLKLKRPRQ